MQGNKESLFDIEPLLQYLSSIDNSRNYWMVRTMGGLYYGDFIRNNFIAIGFDDISLEEINSLPDNFNTAKEMLKIKLSDKYEDISQHGYYASQLLHFAREIKVNDIVIIPSISSAHVAIGIVRSGLYEEPHPILNSDHVCAFKKRRIIEWKVYCRRQKLPPVLQLIFGSRHAVTNITNYSPYVDSLLNNCYYKEDKLHLVLNIKTRADVSMNDFFCLEQVRLWAEDFCQEIGYPVDSPIVMKIQMESPGKMRLESKHILGLLALGFFIITLTGGGLQFSTEDGLNIYTNGLPGAINEYLDRKADREMQRKIIQGLDSLKIENPQDIAPFIELLRVKNEGRRKY